MLTRNSHLVLITVLALLLQIYSVSFAEENCDKAQSCDHHGLEDELILSYEEPILESPIVSPKLLHDRWYKQINARVDVYDAPNGNIVRSIEDGFNFVTVIKEENGWSQINANEWVRSEFLEERNWIVSNFTGVFLDRVNLKYPIAWLLVNLYPSNYPGGSPVESNGLLYRYTRLTIYATAEVDGYEWYQIGIDKWVHQHYVARVLPIEVPQGVLTEQWISIDLYEQVMIAYEGDRPIFATLIATGLDRWPTREGIYHIYYRRTRDDMSGGKVGDDFYMLEEVPWTMFFDEGRALHGAYWHDGFGYRRSHGCVNLSITDAKWLYDWVAESMGSLNSADVEEGPAVFVYSSGVYK